jgi:hypothetical protein
MASNSDGGFQSPTAEVSAANLAKHSGDRGDKIVHLSVVDAPGIRPRLWFSNSNGLR